MTKGRHKMRSSLFHGVVELHRYPFVPGPDLLGKTRNDFCPSMFGVTTGGQVVNDVHNPAINTILFRFSRFSKMKYYYDGGDYYYAECRDEPLTFEEKMRIDKLINKAVDSGSYYIE